MWLYKNTIPNIDTVEKLYLWAYYQLSSTIERIEIEGEKEYLVDAELVRPADVDERLFLVTKIILPFDEEWTINKLKLWENALEILEMPFIYSYIPITEINGYCEQDLTTLPTYVNLDDRYYLIKELSGYCEQDLESLPKFEDKYFTIKELSGYCQQQL